MRLQTFPFLSAALLKSASSQLSFRKCSELGVYFNSPPSEVYGSPLVCGASMVTSGSSNALSSMCTENVTFSVAEEICRDLGARLCTYEELMANEAFETGCDLDFEEVWSSSTSSLGCSPGFAVSSAGSSFSTVSAQCSVTSTRFPTRCCADEPAPVNTSVTTGTLAPTAGGVSGVCINNECSSDQAVENLCIRTSNSSFACICNGPGWTTGPDATSCTPPSSSCLSGDPCSIGANPNNLCVDISIGAYRCACRGLGWRPNTDETGCIFDDPSSNKCANGDDPCGSSLESENFCVYQGGGLHSCVCAAHGWLTPPGSQTCQCPDPCLLKDRCGSSRDSGNSCINLYRPSSRNCGVYSCECNGRGWTTPVGGQFCLPPDPCTLGDPCSSLVGPGNVCIRDNSNPFSRSHQDQAVELASNLGSYKCYCDETGFVSSEDLQSCERCQVTCDKGDPCRSDMDTRNTCSLAQSKEGGCPLIQCECGGSGWKSTADGSECIPCESPCSVAADPCKTTSDSRNICIPATTEDLPWGIYLENTAVYTANDPVPASVPGPVVSESTRRADISEATALALAAAGAAGNGCGLYTCSCGAPGFLSAPGSLSCIGCPDACEQTGGDPCSTEIGSLNVCTQEPHPSVSSVGNSLCGGHKCTCEEPGWKASKDGKSCIPCGDPCAEDPCNSAADPSNVCLPTASQITRVVSGRRLMNHDNLPNTVFSSAGNCGGYICQCKGVGWTVGAQAQSCQNCRNPCSEGDPCNSLIDNRNKCVAEELPAFPRNLLTSPRMLLQARKVKSKKSKKKKKHPVPIAVLFSTSQASDGDDDLLLRNAEDEDTLSVQPVSRGVCGIYRCDCHVGSWITSEDRQTCQQCVNPCDSGGDLCLSSLNNKNKCIPTAPSIEEPCGGYRCECDGDGWMTARDESSCLACPSPCAVESDPCNAAIQPRNLCLPEGPYGQALFSPSLYREFQEAAATPGIPFELMGFTNNRLASESPVEAAIPPVSLFTAAINEAPRTGSGVRQANSDTGSFSQSSSAPSLLSRKSKRKKKKKRKARSPASDATKFPTIVVSSPPTFKPAVSSSLTPTTSLSTLSPTKPLPHLTPSMLGGNCPAFTCQCGEPGWFQASSSRACTECPDPCASDPCNTRFDLNNVCKPTDRILRRSVDPLSNTLENCPAHTCSCDGVGWTASKEGQRQSCEPCANPCEVGDPCSSSFGQGNVCVPAPQSGCESYQCVCEAPNFVVSDDAKSCQDCPNPCMDNPCRSNEDARNTCVPVDALAAFAAGTETSSGLLGTCPGYVCRCGPNHKLSEDGSTCEACPEACDPVEDPCGTRGDSRNRCIPVIGDTSEGVGRCTSHICQCLADDWLPSIGSKSCHKCPNPCISTDESNPCSTSGPNGSVSNLCIPEMDFSSTTEVRVNGGQVARLVFFDPVEDAGKCEQYSCECNGAGFTDSLDRKSCRACGNPCASDPCSTSLSASNICVPGLPTGLASMCPSFSCKCNGPGWIQGPDDQTCEACPNPCAQDPCSSILDNRNVCVPISNPGTCDGFRCACGAQGYLAGPDDTTCLECKRPCSSEEDSCATKQSPLNLCLEIPDSVEVALAADGKAICGGFVCACQDPLWQQGSAGRTCEYTPSATPQELVTTVLQCPNPCYSDPCNTALDRQNICIPSFSQLSARDTQLYLELVAQGGNPAGETLPLTRQVGIASSSTVVCPPALYQCICAEQWLAVPTEVGSTCVSVVDVLEAGGSRPSSAGEDVAAGLNDNNSAATAAVSLSGCPSWDPCVSSVVGNVCIPARSDSSAYRCLCAADGYETDVGSQRCLP